MHKCAHWFWIAAITAFSYLGSAEDNGRSLKESMMADFDTIHNIFEFHYAPREWKKKHFGWSLKDEVQKAKAKIQHAEKITVRGYQEIVNHFFRAAKDYHVTVEFYSTESATLPFRIQGAEGKYFLTEINQNQLSPKVFPWNIGDELVAFDGHPVQEVIDNLKKDIGRGNDATDNALAEIALTSRDAALGYKVPKGPLIVTLKSLKTSKLSSYQLIWDYTPEKIPGGFAPIHSMYTPCLLARQHESSTPLHPLFEDQMLSPIYCSLAQASHPKSAHDLAAKKSFLPPLGKVLWETEDDDTFHAYLCQTPDGASVGYIRIHQYAGKENEVEEFQELIANLEENSDLLVIDQMNNPGGSVFYMYALASMLTDQPLYTPKHRSSLSPREISTAVKLISSIESASSEKEAQELFGETYVGTPVTLQMVKFFLNYFRFLVSEWDAGKTLSDPFYLYGIDCINPHPKIRYTKPIIILVNALSFSGADFLPAIFQDNHRARIFGSRTAGAGGHMTSVNFPNRFGIKSFSYTRSIAERLDHTPIEGLGVTPDIPYSLTQEDLQYDYRGMVKAIQEAIASDLIVSPIKKG